MKVTGKKIKKCLLMCHTVENWRNKSVFIVVFATESTWEVKFCVRLDCLQTISARSKAKN